MARCSQLVSSFSGRPDQVPSCMRVSEIAGCRAAASSPATGLQVESDQVNWLPHMPALILCLSERSEFSEPYLPLPPPAPRSTAHPLTSDAPGVERRAHEKLACRAAVAIQSAWRSFHVRRRYLTLLASTLLIQRTFRSHQVPIPPKRRLSSGWSYWQARQHPGVGGLSV